MPIGLLIFVRSSSRQTLPTIDRTVELDRARRDSLDRSTDRAGFDRSWPHVGFQQHPKFVRR